MPRQEQFLISGLPDVSDPSSRHSQQLGQSEVVPSDLMASEESILCNVDDDDNTVLHVEDVVATERSHDVVECSQEEIVGGSVIISSSSRSERRRNLPSEAARKMTTIMTQRRLVIVTIY